MATETMTYTGKLTILACWCGIKHAVPSDLRDYQVRMHDNGRGVPSIYCPLGHAHVPSGDGAAVREREARARAERAARNAEEAARIQREKAASARRTAIALRGHLTRMRNRIENGVCPVPGCKRAGFANVMRHIASQHPDWHHDHADEL